MQTYTAHVGENGRIVTDEKTDLPPGRHVKIAILEDFTLEEEAAEELKSGSRPRRARGPSSGV